MPVNGRQAALWGGLLSLGILLVVLKSSPPPTPKRAETPLDEASMERFSFVQTDRDGWQWNVSAVRGHTPEGQTVVVEGVAMTIRPPGGVAMHVKADTGTLDLSTHDFSLQNDALPIQVTSDSGPTLQSAALHWHDRTKTLTADGPVFLQSQTLRILGDTLVVDFPKRQMRVKGSVKTTLLRKSAVP